MALRLTKIGQQLALPLRQNSSSRSSFLSNSIRTMASAAPRKYEYLVVVPDFPGVRDKRLEIRPQHFANLKTYLDNGTFKMGGAVLSEVPPDDEPSSLQFAGSTLVAVASSREEVLDILKGDVYAKNGVWDVEKAQIWPLKCAFRSPL